MTPLARRWLFFGLAFTVIMSLAGLSAAQHDPESADHLLGTGAFGQLELVSSLRVHDAADDVIADLTVLGSYAYLAKWGAPDCAGPESGGQNSPDGGVYVVDISDLSAPVEVGFIASRQDTLVGEGMHAIPLDTSAFSGDLLALNHELCGKNGRGGFSLWDITDPLKARRLSENLGDFTVDEDRNQPHGPNQYHSVFVWDAGSSAYLVGTDDEEFIDVDIYDITDPRKPVLVSETDLNQYGVSQPDLVLTDSFLHDMVVKQIGSRFIMLLSYWDGGFVLLDVTNPASPVFLGDSEYAAIDPQLLEQTGVALTPEGNGHEAEFTLDNRFVVGTGEDFDPFRAVVTTPDGTFRAGIGTNTDPADVTGLSGSTFFVGRACPGDPAPPVGPGTGATEIAVIERGLCLFTEKLAIVEAAGGYDAAIIINREGPGGCTAVFNPSLEATIPVLFIGRDVGYAMFGLTYDQAACEDTDEQLAPIALGTQGDDLLDVQVAFDGWGYVHLFAVEIGASSATLTELDTYAIEEAFDPAFASGFGALSVHEAATDKTNPNRVYLSYYSGGMRALEIECSGPSDCELVEIGGFIDPDSDGSGPDPGGNEFWGVETFERDGTTYVLGSDMDSGLWILKVTD